MRCVHHAIACKTSNGQRITQAEGVAHAPTYCYTWLANSVPACYYARDVARQSVRDVSLQMLPFESHVLVWPAIVRPSGLEAEAHGLPVNRDHLRQPALPIAL